MQRTAYIPWSGNTFSPGKEVLLATTNEKGIIPDLQVDGFTQSVNSYAPYKRNNLMGVIGNFMSKMYALVGQNGSKCTEQIQTPATAAYASGKEEKKDPCSKKSICVSSTMPILETKLDGLGRLSVPLSYDSIPDNVTRTPTGVYAEDPSPALDASRDTNRTTVGRRRRRRKQCGGTINSQQPATATPPPGCGEKAKVGGKNRKDKKRQHLRKDIRSDCLAASLDDGYGYDYRECEFEDAIGSVSLSQFCLPSSLTDSSLGSVSSFHDALQDTLVMEACLKEPFRSANTTVGSEKTPPQQQDIPMRCSSNSSITTPAATAPMVSDRVTPKCDIETDRNGFVMFSEFEVFTTPSASPARRIPRAGNLCKAFSYVWKQQFSDASVQDEEEEEEDDEEDGSSGDEDSADEIIDDDDDNDDDSVVFCEDLDDDNDDSNSSSGFEEKKVRFNTNPVIHVMRAWDFAYRQARKGEWEMAARDRERFRKRIDDLEPVLGPALLQNTRDRVYAERFSDENASAAIMPQDRSVNPAT